MATKDLIVDPLQPGAVYAVTTVNTVLKSTDYGVSWKSANAGLGVSGRELDALYLDIDPTIPGRLYAVRGGSLYLSTDSADQWELVYGAGAGGPSVGLLSLVRSDPPVIYLMTKDSLHRSDDRGVTWRKDSSALAFEIRVLAVSPADPDILYVSTSGAIIYKSTDAGATWRRPVYPNLFGAVPRPDDQVTTLLIDESDPETVYAAGRLLYRTTNAGTSWRELTPPAYPADRSGILHLQIHDGVLYSHDQISRDGGQTWEKVFPDLGLVWDLAFDPDRPGVIYMATEDGAFVSQNSGAEWADLLMPPAQITDVMADPLDPAFLYVGATTRQFAGAELFRRPADGGDWQESETEFSVIARFIPGVIPGQAFVITRGVYETVDQGRTWHNTTPTPTFYGTITAFAVDPTDPAVRFVGSEAHGVFHFRGWLSKTIDAGLNYSQLTTEYFFARDLAIDPSDSRVLYAAAIVGEERRGSLFKSTDGGVAWWESGQGLNGVSPVRVFLNPQNPSQLFLISSTGRLFQSTDAAATWMPVGEDSGITQVTDLVLDLVQPEIIYALTNRGLVVSTNAGAIWAPIDPPPPSHLELTCLTVALERSRTLYVGTQGDGVWKLNLHRNGTRQGSRRASRRGLR